MPAARPRRQIVGDGFVALRCGAISGNSIEREWKENLIF